MRSEPEEVVRHPHELVRVRPDKRVVGAIDHDELGASDPVVGIFAWWIGTA